MLFKSIKNSLFRKKKFKFCEDIKVLFNENTKIIKLIEDSMNLYFIGISGTGMSALVKLFIGIGKNVSGSTDKENDITKKLMNSNVKVYIGHSKDNISKDIDLVIYSEAINKDNEELIRARELNIPTISYGEGLSYFFNNQLSVAVAGTHGKSSTTAILTEIVSNSYKTAFLCGSIIKRFETNGGFIENSNIIEKLTNNEILFYNYYALNNQKNDSNKNDIDNIELNNVENDTKVFIGEACEYRETFQNFFPSIILITSVDEDHLDYYKNWKNYLNSFKHFLSHIKYNGDFLTVKKNIVLHVNSKNEIKLANYICSRKDLRERAIFYTPNKSFFLSNCCKYKDIPIVYYQYLGFDKNLKIFNTRIYFNNAYKKDFGKFNEFDLFFPFPSDKYAGNITGAYIVSRILDIFNEVIFTALMDYKGIERRFDYLGSDVFNNKIYTDYAHHPSEIKTLLEMFRELYSNEKIIFIFQPHQYSRTFYLFDEFMDSFYNADMTLILPIYEQRDTPNDINKINSSIFVQGLLKKGVNALEIKDENELFSFLENNIENSIIVFCGAGDIINSAKRYIKNYIKV